MPRVSVIIPTRSRPAQLTRAVKSAQAAGRDVEVVVVDDASTDETQAVCRSLAGIRYVRLERNQGTAGARNVGLLASSAPFIAFLDDDDVRLPGTIDLQVEALERTPEAALVYGQVELVGQDGERLGRVEPQRLPTGTCFWELVINSFVYASATIVRRECFLRVGLINPALTGYDEWDLWVRIADISPILALPGVVSLYRLPSPRSDQATTALSASIALGIARHQLELLELPTARSASPARRKQVRRATLAELSDRLIFMAADDLRDGERVKARDKLIAAIRLNPTRAVRPWTARLLVATGFPTREKER